MRLDKFLKVSRLIKRRTLAQVEIENGFVFLNYKATKCAAEVHVGDVITIVRIEKKYKVVKLLESATEEIAKTMYEEVK